MSPCAGSPCGNLTCIDLTENGTVWEEEIWEESLWDLYGLEDKNDTEGYECVTPCQLSPCGNYSECVDLIDYGNSKGCKYLADRLIASFFRKLFQNGPFSHPFLHGFFSSEKAKIRDTHGFQKKMTEILDYMYVFSILGIFLPKREIFAYFKVPLNFLGF